MQPFSSRNHWALILGGSSGIGLASAKKLAELGLNLFIVHRDRRGSMAQINKDFDEIRTHGVQLETINTNALSQEGVEDVLSQVKEKISGRKIRVMLHSIALGNLKVVAPTTAERSPAVDQLAQELGIDKNTLQEKIDGIFSQGADDLVELATPPSYNNDTLMGEEDMSATIYNMGTSLLQWAQRLNADGLFADDARIIGLTSEGNEIAWRGYAAVAAAKCALESVARSLALELAPFGVRTNILQPGVTDTPALRLIPGSRHMKARAQSRNPYGRLTTPEDVANVVGLLSLDEASWINGTIIRVDGGEHISG